MATSAPKTNATAVSRYLRSTFRLGRAWDVHNTGDGRVSVWPPAHMPDATAVRKVAALAAEINEEGKYRAEASGTGILYISLPQLSATN